MSQAIINNRFLEESVFAIADGYCVINLTKNIVRGSMYQVVNGKKYKRLYNIETGQWIGDWIPA